MVNYLPRLTRKFHEIKSVHVDPRRNTRPVVEQLLGEPIPNLLTLKLIQGVKRGRSKGRRLLQLAKHPHWDQTKLCLIWVHSVSDCFPALVNHILMHVSMRHGKQRRCLLATDARDMASRDDVCLLLTHKSICCLNVIPLQQIMSYPRHWVCIARLFPRMWLGWEQNEERQKACNLHPSIIQVTLLTRDCEYI